MGDGFGPSLGEMGISTVKKTANVVKKQGNLFIQGAASQITGKPTQQPPQNTAANIPSSKPPGESDPTKGQFDLSSFAKSLKSQVSGGVASNGKQQSGTFVMPKTSQPPSETAPKQAGNFDIGNSGNTTVGTNMDTKNPFEALSNLQPQQTGPTQAEIKQQQKNEDWQKNEEEKKQKLESLRKKLHEEQVRKELEAGETKATEEQQKQAKEDQEQQEKERKEQEEEQKMAPIVGPLQTGSKKSWGFLGMNKVKNSLMNMIRPKATKGETGKNRG